MKKLTNGILLMLVATLLIVSLVPAISFATSATNTEKTDADTVKITSKAKTALYNINWNGNGGKIGTKKTVITTVKKGFKLNKLTNTPKRSGYTFKGWYTKKSGGTKITKNTKPTRSATFYAQWKRESKRVLTTEEKKFVGAWSAGPYLAISNSNRWIEFKNDGTFKRENSNIGRIGEVEGYWYNMGKWKIVGNKIVCTNIKETWMRKPGTGKYVGDYTNRAIADQTWNYYFSNENGLTWLNINHYPSDKELSRVEYYVKPTLAN